MLLDAGRLAVGTLTALPVPAPNTIDRRRAGLAMVLAPLVAVLLLVPPAVLVTIAHLAGLPPLVQATVCIIALALCTRGLHLDGLADTADGLSASYDRDRALAVMRTGDVGPSGVAAVTLTLILQIACGTVLLGSHRGMALAGVAVLVSRAALTWACTRGVPAARPGGLGATVAQSVHPAVAAGATVLLAGVSVAATALTGSPWWCGLVVVAGGFVAAAGVVGRCVSRIGGISGDVLGASVETTLAVGLLVAAACS
ncbi:adenosylcobinamide-GDP ribazoletransferase [Leekyejoonella antrihumi]|uniref:Adenosylcobinamide-GDP ribazoletransferase n=1 Tax=Leekyejoonella antrihumi TaxID=1660198 RepID=A0A563E3D2_9MICO|nr:adenosylcobinamide-GDP ribazoletransferase [Leekyejoonella antrihumi]TWP37028.1 adenosylcobinamide-GDP ribazoletransferase [Leekyejoonella antrihumi]